MTGAGELLALLEQGDERQRQHALQTADLLAAGRPDDLELQVAGLLHDVGHLLAPGDDVGHGEAAAAAVAPVLGGRVADLVRLHVPAKRYLVTVEPSYRDVLAPDSTASLAGQGDTLSRREVEEFESERHAADAVVLRRADDGGKVPGRDVGDLARWRATVDAVAARWGGR